MSAIKNYYRLCAVSWGTHYHLIEEILPKNLELVFTKKELELYMRKRDGKYVAREIVVGARETADDVRKARQETVATKRITVIM